MTLALPPSVNTIIDLALEEDLGRGDITTRLSVPKEATAKAAVIARDTITLSGTDVFSIIMKKVSPEIQVSILKGDGQTAMPGETVIETQGPVQAMLMAERVALNFLQRICGVATLTRQFVDAIGQDSKTRIVDTRKTSPGMRFLERRAVLHGGGFNHRVDLSGGVLIKENHIAAAGSIEAAVKNCKDGAAHTLKVEIEVTNETELKQALAAGADAVLLDNMTPEQIKSCVKIADGKAVLEASGGINLQTIRGFGQTGVDIISVGALTHSAPAADLSFLIEGA